MTAEDLGSVDVDGRKLSWRSVGHGPPLVLLNGYSATATDWDPTLLGTLAGEFEVLCLDHRGMGESELGDPGAVTIDGMAADVERLLDARGIDHAPVAGWSMGGFITQQLGRHAPDRVDAMVLLGTDPGGAATVRADPEVWARLIDHSGTPRERASRMIPLLFPPALVPAIDAAFGDMMAEVQAQLSQPALRAQEEAMRQWHGDDQESPDPATAPRALVLSGSEDIVIPPQNADALATVWSGCRTELFQGGGHAFFALEPQRAADLIIAFCREQPVDDWQIAVTDVSADVDAAELRDALFEFNFETTGYRDGRALSCFLRDDGRLVAGIDGFTWGGYARIEYLWVDETRRGNGLGSRLLLAAEEEARRRGCVTIVLDTHSFQAPDLYRNRGYIEIGTTTDTPLGYSQSLFQKTL